MLKKTWIIIITLITIAIIVGVVVGLTSSDKEKTCDTINCTGEKVCNVIGSDGCPTCKSPTEKWGGNSDRDCDGICIGGGNGELEACNEGEKAPCVYYGDKTYLDCKGKCLNPDGCPTLQCQTPTERYGSDSFNCEGNCIIKEEQKNGCGGCGSTEGVNVSTGCCNADYGASTETGPNGEKKNDCGFCVAEGETDPTKTKNTETGCCPNGEGPNGQQKDTCGICGGNGIPEGQCDCEGNTLDACGVCGGALVEYEEKAPDGSTLYIDSNSSSGVIYCNCAGEVYDSTTQSCPSCTDGSTKDPVTGCCAEGQGGYPKDAWGYCSAPGTRYLSLTIDGETYYYNEKDVTRVDKEDLTQDDYKALEDAGETPSSDYIYNTLYTIDKNTVNACGSIGTNCLRCSLDGVCPAESTVNSGSVSSDNYNPNLDMVLTGTKDTDCESIQPDPVNRCSYFDIKTNNDYAGCGKEVDDDGCCDSGLGPQGQLPDVETGKCTNFTTSTLCEASDYDTTKECSVILPGTIMAFPYDIATAGIGNWIPCNGQQITVTDNDTKYQDLVGIVSCGVEGQSNVITIPNLNGYNTNDNTNDTSNCVLQTGQNPKFIRGAMNTSNESTSQTITYDNGSTITIDQIPEHVHNYKNALTTDREASGGSRGGYTYINSQAKPNTCKDWKKSNIISPFLLTDSVVNNPDKVEVSGATGDAEGYNGIYTRTNTTSGTDDDDNTIPSYVHSSGEYHIHQSDTWKIGPSNNTNALFISSLDVEEYPYDPTGTYSQYGTTSGAVTVSGVGETQTQFLPKYAKVMFFMYAGRNYA